MDTEENIEIQKAKIAGHPQTDEGPYYHDAWWESYKASAKGKLGGAVIGALLGVAVGAVATMALSFTAAAGISALAVIAGFSAAGMLYGAHEFSDIGKHVGSDAAVAEKQEQRQKVYFNGRIAMLEEKIDDVKALIAGKKPTTSSKQSLRTSEVAEATLNDYRTTHCTDHCPPDKPKFIFWKVAAIGLAVGLAAGAVLAATPLAAGIAEAVGLGETFSHGAVAAITMITTGLFGASFGVNRDMFRQVFDKTDLAFKGIVGKDTPSPTPQIEAERTAQPESSGKPQQPKIATIIYDSCIDYPKSDTYHRDKALAAANQALHGLDPTTISRPH